MCLPRSYMSLMRSLIAEGAVGKVMNIQHLEPVGWYHVSVIAFGSSTVV